MNEQIAPEGASDADPIQALKVQSETLLAAINEIAARAKTELAIVEAARQRADEHARDLATAKGAVDADSGQVAKAREIIEQSQAATNSARASAEADAKALLEAKAGAEDSAGKISAARETALAAQGEAGAAAAQLKIVLQVAIQNGEAIERAKAAAESNGGLTQIATDTASEASTKATAANNEISETLTSSKELFKKLGKVVTTSTEAQLRVDEYEKKLAELTKATQEIRVKIEKLLPGATSAGLAASFQDQKARFKTPQRNWLIAGLVALALLLVVGAIGLPGLPLLGSSQDSSFDGGMLKHILARLPLAIPLIWIALYAGHNNMVALRMEEDYAFKEAVSRAFEGYKREMTNIPGVGETDKAPLVTLCTNVLTALAERPGRIYEGKHESITPMSQVTKAIKDLSDSVAAALKKPDGEGE